MSKQLKREYIRYTLKKVTHPETNTQDPYVYVTTPSTGVYKDLPNLLFFDPILQLKCNLKCRVEDERHQNYNIRTTSYWTDYGKFPPRLIYGLERNAYLVCRIYYVGAFLHNLLKA